EGYRCICEWGYRSTTNTSNPYCEDVDECSANPCFPGSACNGFQCVDKNECENPDLTTCSKNPPVDCINTIGSYRCGTCPPGYIGDGHICELINPCNLQPCYPDAICYNMKDDGARDGGYRCECPKGMIGDGIGAEGCFRSNTTLCVSDTCYNEGTCQIIADTEFKCHCMWGYVGKRCETATECLNDACNGRGKCIPLDAGGFKCHCSIGYFGEKCEFEEDGSVSFEIV
ncbi:unnamed protein product, partial [Dracunculus medinensis]|uniref:EGF-like domain-containing protein n=1 Tax=Dracunculus medinensis TaxID=318479 RepID=A0A0N4UR18_DRAME